MIVLAYSRADALRRDRPGPARRTLRRESRAPDRARSRGRERPGVTSAAPMPSVRWFASWHAPASTASGPPPPACGSCSSPRCTPGRTRRTSARSSRRWSTRSRLAATSSRGPSSTAAEAAAGTRGSRSTCSGPRTRFDPMSSTRTSSSRRAFSPPSRAARRSSSPPTGRTSRTRAATARSGRRRSSRCGGRTRSSRCRPGCSTGSSRWCPRRSRRAP